MRRSILATALSAALLATAACSDPFATGPWRVDATYPDTVQLYTLGRDSLLGKPSAFDFTDVARTRVVVESPGETGNWDVALTDQGGGLVLMPPGALQAFPRSSQIALLPATAVFDSLKKAPAASDSIVYRDSTTVPVIEGRVYIVRTRAASCYYGVNGHYYAKMEVLSADYDAGTMRFRYIADPNCNDPSFVSPKK